MSERIAVIGLGYVGLPVALAFAKQFPNTIGFDISEERVSQLRDGVDKTDDVSGEELRTTSLQFTCEADDLKDCNFYVVAVPTPVDEHHRPNLTPLEKASELVGQVVAKGDIAVFESTVYPGVTEEYCAPIIERVSGLRSGKDFFLGYSPERINPGDQVHTLETIVKVVSGENEETLAKIAQVYGKIIKAGIHKASSIKVAEAAKVIENTQRDLNIALMNELAIIFDRMDLPTRDVLAAAQTKWNFLGFSPGLVGGHCIGVDPYYLTTKAEQLGYHPQVILAGRRINDGMGSFIAQHVVKMLANEGRQILNARVGVLGLTFKENVSDLRNSKVPDIVTELRTFGIDALVHDPLASNEVAEEEYGISLTSWDSLEELDACVLAVCHREYMDMPLELLTGVVKQGGALVDVKSMLDPASLRSDIDYWSL